MFEGADLELSREDLVGEDFMNIKNNIIDKLEKDSDIYFYALSIGLKSGEVVYLDGISRGEKNGYLNFAKYSNETMLLEIDNALWRIQAQDIESMTVKQYGKYDNPSNFYHRIFLSNSRFRRSTYLLWIKLFFFGAFLALLMAGMNSIFGDGDLMGILMDSQHFKNFVQRGASYVSKVFILIYIILVVTFLIDLLLPSEEAYRKIKPYRDYASNPRIQNLILIVLFLFFYKIIAFITSRLA